MRAHLVGEDDGRLTVQPILSRVSDCNELLQPGLEQHLRNLRNAEGTGRPLSTPEFVAGLEALLGRRIAGRAPGRKPASTAAVGEQLELL